MAVIDLFCLCKRILFSIICSECHISGITFCWRSFANLTTPHKAGNTFWSWGCMWCTHLHIAWDISPPPWWFTVFYLLEYHAWIWRSITRASQKRHETHHLILGAPFSPNFHADGTGYQGTGMIELGGFLITWLEDSPRLHFLIISMIHSCTSLRFILVFLGVDFLVTAKYASLGFRMGLAFCGACGKRSSNLQFKKLNKL